MCDTLYTILAMEEEWRHTSAEFLGVVEFPPCNWSNRWRAQSYVLDKKYQVAIS